jgi:hypothetical protein
MKQKYTLSQQYLAWILLLGLFLQSCNRLPIEPMQQEKEKEEIKEKKREPEGNLGHLPTHMHGLDLDTDNNATPITIPTHATVAFTEQRGYKEGIESPTSKQAILVHGHYSLGYGMVDLPAAVEQKKFKTKKAIAIAPNTQAFTSLTRTRREVHEVTEQEMFNPRSITINPKAELITTQGGIIQAHGLKISIPKDAVKDDTFFSIKPAPREIELPEGIDPVSAVYAIEPHNIELRDRIKLEFDLNDSSSPVALFIQKDKPEDKKLKKWLAIEPTKVENRKATFEIASCSFPFVAKLDIKKDYSHSTFTNSTTKVQFQDHNIIRPGLNYRALCENTSCPWHTKMMIINRGFNPSFKIDDDVMNQEAKCLTCQQPLQDTESIKQVILFQAQGKVKYWEQGARPASSSFTAQDDKLVIYGEVGNTVSYKSVIFEVNPTPFNPKVPMAVVKFDNNGNPIGSIFDLGMNGAYKDVKLLIGKFFNGEGFTKDSFKNHAGKALDQKGFNWKCTEDEDEFLKELPEADVAWVISASIKEGNGCTLKLKNPTFPNQVIDFHKQRKGLMLWEDNDSEPGQHTNSVLQKLFGITVEGNDPGEEKMVAAANCHNSLTFSKLHPIMTGINKLYEGVTICHPTAVPSPLRVLATSSANHPNIIYVDETATTGRIIIDCGFTKLFSNRWDTAGTARYVKNATCWLSGFPYDNT